MLRYTYIACSVNFMLVVSNSVDIAVFTVAQVMQLAENLLDNLQLAMKGRNDDEQFVGPCFVELADQMKHVYGHYCMNHNGALTLLEKVSGVQLLAVENERISSALTCLTCTGLFRMIVRGFNNLP